MAIVVNNVQASPRVTGDTMTLTYTIPAGSDRLLVVAVHSTRSTQSVDSAFFGTTALTAGPIANYPDPIGSSNGLVFWYYLREADFPGTLTDDIEVVINRLSDSRSIFHVWTLTGAGQSIEAGAEDAAGNVNPSIINPHLYYKQ